MSLPAAFAAVVQRDLLLAWRRRVEFGTTLGFFVLAALLFPLGAGAEPALLRRIGPGVLWVAALLASLLSLGRLFAADHADGTLEQLLLGGEPPAALVLAKIVAHWLVAGLPLVLLAAPLALAFGLPADALAPLAAGLLLGTPLLSLIGAVGAALTLGLRGGGMLLGLLVLPLYAPVLVFGAGSVDAAGPAPLLLLAGLLLAALALAPWAGTAALRIAIE